MGSSVDLKTSYAPLNRHDAFYTGGKVQASIDGQYLFCSNGSKVKVFNISTGCVDCVIEEDGDLDISCFIVSPDDRYLITANPILLLRQWNWKQKTVLRTWRSEHRCPVVCMTFDPSSTLLATGSSDSTVKVWDIEKQYCTNNLRGHQGVVSLVQFHPDTSNCRLLTASDDYVIRLWDLQTHGCLAELGGHFSTVTSLQFSRGCSVMYSASRDSTVFVWDMTTFKKKAISVFEPIESLILFPKSETEIGNSISDDECFVTAGNQGILKVWSVAKSTCVSQSQKLDRITAGSEQETNELSFVYADYIKVLDVILAVTYSGNIILYRKDDFSFFKQFAGNNDEVYCIRFFGTDDRSIAVATNSSAIKVFDVSTWSCQIVTGHTDIVMSLDTHDSDGTTYMVSGGKDNAVRLWTINNATGHVDCRAVGIGHNRTVSAVVLLKCNSEYLVSASNDLSLKLWRYSVDGDGKGQLRVKQTVTGVHSKDINAVTVSPKDRFIATASQDKTAKLWDTMSLSLVAVFSGHSRGVQCVQFSPTENILGTSSADKTIKLWELKNFKCIKTFEGHESSVLSFQFLSRGLQLISSGADGLVKLWLVRTNECTKTFDEHEDKVWTLAVNKKEDRLITGSADSRILIWEDRTEEEKEAQRIKNQEFIENQERLENLLLDKKFNKAFALAILLEQPFRALNILKDIWKLPTREEYLTATLSQLRSDQIETVLEFASVWNSNSKHSHVAQAVIAMIFKTLGPDRLLEFSNIRKLVENLLPYTERHHSRLKLLEQKSEFIDYACMLSSILEPMDVEHS